MRDSLRRLVPVLLAASVLLAAGCATWRPIERAKIAATVNESQPDWARVRTRASIVEISHPTVRADTLRGTLRQDHRVPFSASLASIDSLYLVRPTPTRWPLTVLVGATAVLLAEVFIIPHGQTYH